MLPRTDAVPITLLPLLGRYNIVRRTDEKGLATRRRQKQLEERCFFQRATPVVSKVAEYVEKIRCSC